MSPGKPDIRWNDGAKVFLVDYGNVHMALTKTAAVILADALREAARNLHICPRCGCRRDEDGRGCDPPDA
jgi:hypothetical protein